ncbi:39S ribosomal protein L17, mitochondrial [Macrosteles quadrilineatus]|uniref:39S ribosomal protein L17, mitochondrial n=1 Tax=Macrosteles quadrilineatus TaxID=74068 RepID=UPI0023E34D1D|nr:39S ribosomal protein L17, mitochondrial [Macrosteles quadrilineatus]
MPQADVSKLVSQLKINISPGYRRLKNIKGPEGRHEILRKILTGLFKYERIELKYTKADEARGYAERLISEAIRHGDTHKPTMELADYWIEDKRVVHKLFKVLAPRYENYNIAYTRMFKVSGFYPEGGFPKSVLELKGNPFPPLTTDLSNNRSLLHNVLLDEAKKEYRAEKYAEMAEQLSAESSNEENSTTVGKNDSVTEDHSDKAVVDDSTSEKSEKTAPSQDNPDVETKK